MATTGQHVLTFRPRNVSSTAVLARC